MINCISLSDLIHDAKIDRPKTKTVEQIMTHMLGEKQIEALVKMIGHGCRKETKNRLWRRLSLPLSLLQNHGIYDRLIITDNGCDYTCGQSWTDEMRVLRDCLLKN